MTIRNRIQIRLDTASKYRQKLQFSLREFQLPFFYLFFFLQLILFTAEGRSQNNSNLDNLFRIAQGYEFAGQFDKAEPIYRNLFEQQSWNYTYFDALNKIYIKQKKFAESIKLLEERIQKEPQDINTYGMLGSTYFMMDDTGKAYDIWEKGIAVNTSNIAAYRTITNYAIENRAFEKAIDFLERGKKISEDPSIFSLDLANIYAANMRFADAAKEYCSLLENRPAQIGSVKSRIASYLSRQGSIEATIETIKNFAEEKPLPQILDLLTFVYTSTEKFDEALTASIEYDRTAKSNGNYIYNLAQDAFRNKKFDVASQAYDYIIKNYPSSTLVPVSKIGYANTLEASIVEKFSVKSESWKPFIKPEIVNAGDFLSIINAYDQLAKQYSGSTIYSQALFNMAKIYSVHLLNYKKADSIFSIINLNNAVSNYSSQAFIEQGKIAIINNNLEGAKKYFSKAVSAGRKLPEELTEANFYLARIEFWKGNFSQSLKLFQNITKNLSTDFANDAIELSSLINTTKRDSLNLYKYAKADLYSLQNRFNEAAIEFKTLADNPNMFILNEFAEYKLAQMFIANNDYLAAIKILSVLSENEDNAIFADKSLFLLAQTYKHGLKDVQKAAQNYEKLLEKFPNSLYFDRARDSLKDLQTNSG